MYSVTPKYKEHVERLLAYEVLRYARSGASLRLSGSGDEQTSFELEFSPISINRLRRVVLSLEDQGLLKSASDDHTAKFLYVPWYSRRRRLIKLLRPAYAAASVLTSEHTK